MAYTSWNTAHGEAAPMTLRVEFRTTSLSPADDSVDTNTIIIEGAGTILSFGDSPHIVLKRVKFQPLVMAGRVPPGGGGGGAVIELVNSISLNLLSGQRRSINGEAYGLYFCPGDSTWNEVYFVQKGTFTPAELEVRSNELEERVAELERRLKVLES